MADTCLGEGSFTVDEDVEVWATEGDWNRCNSIIRSAISASRETFLTAESDTTVSLSAQFQEELKEDLAIETIELLLKSKYNETGNLLGHAQVLQLLKDAYQDVLHVRRDNLRRGKRHTNLFTDFEMTRMSVIQQSAHQALRFLMKRGAVEYS
nr:unnamed protein product [Spirometra erinaceieuropaei]